ncbi:MAG: hypothetical protein K0S65_5828, partial [Labilithrix sp.]|nr:hypothetical protein [Labilithrix sp.]
MVMSSLRTRGSLMLLLAAYGAACGGSPPEGSPPATPPPAPRTAGPIAAPESVAERADADIERKTAMGATVAVPRGWYFKADSSRYSFEEPDRQFAMTLVEVEANDTNLAITKA